MPSQVARYTSLRAFLGGLVVATAWPKRLIVLLVLFATLATMSPAVSAQTDPTEAPRLTPEVFEPGPINRTPSGGPPPTGDLDVLREVDHQPQELVERRTEDSRTFVGQDGKFETVFYGGPIHYRDARGQWQPIDNTLVPAQAAGAAFRNAAGQVQVSLPSVLGVGPVRASRDDVSVAFALRGANATPSLGVPKTLPARTSEAMKQATATYASAIPGVDISYTATAGGVKEDLVLAGPSSPSSFDFTVELSPGLSAVETKAGGISFVDAGGTERASFAPPFAYDASYQTSGAGRSFTEDAVSLRIVETSPQLVVRLAADRAWLDAPDRAWPVVIDPVLTITGATADTYVSRGSPDTNYGASSRLYLYGGSSARRALHGKTIEDFFNEPVTVYAADLELYATVDTSSSPTPAGAFRLDTPGWNSNQATWNSRLTGTPWNTPGGDFRPEPLFVNNAVTGPAGWRSWTITKAVQAWLDGEPNLGVLVKYVDESTGALVPFASSNDADPTRLPRIVVKWEALAGARDPFTYEEFDLGPGGAASVNVASGNLTVAKRDLAVAGTGPAATVDRFYQSRLRKVGSVGARWRMWPQSEERLYLTSNFTNNQDIGLAGGPEELVIFSHNPDGSYTSPHGYRATMVKNPDGTYTLTSHGDSTRTTFSSSGYVKDFTDRNGNSVTFNYTYDALSGESFMTSMTDTQGRVTTFERAGEYEVTKMTDSAGRVHQYGYTDDSFGNPRLSTYTDPAGKITRYDYAGDNFLSRITDANGNVTKLVSDADGRLTSLTRVTDPVSGTGPTWTFDYSTPWQTKVSNANGKTTTHHFDRRGRVTKVIDALGHERQSTYDSSSNVIDRTSAMGNKSINTFDANNNLNRPGIPGGSVPWK
ncbi:MAG: DNRLRE domain-containing protein [Actinomycetota bacterium]|nr:DNRLRE domain-containing protein [Actinomycetota bacterium]